MTAASHSSWASPGWSQLILTAAASCVLTWLAFAARSGVDPHAGWRQSVRALVPRSASDAAHSWPSSLRYACECVLHAAPSPQHAAPQAVLARNLPKASSMSQRCSVCSLSQPQPHLTSATAADRAGRQLQYRSKATAARYHGTHAMCAASASCLRHPAACLAGWTQQAET